MKRWPNQERAFSETTDALLAGSKRICVVSPTGTGKTICMADLIQWATDQQLRVLLLTNRRMLLEQTHAALDRLGIPHGIIASGYKNDVLWPTNLGMVQTMLARLRYKRKIGLYRADLVIIDELHANCNRSVKLLVQPHLEDDAALVGYTATPLDIDMVDELIVAGNVSDGRACGALVPAITYGPDEPDVRTIRHYRVGHGLTEAENVSAVMRPGVFGRVFETWQRLNPEQLPTVGFGPDVAGSLHFAEDFWARGVPCAHIDGSRIWINGQFRNATQSNREILANMSRRGVIKVIWNRYVLREGIDFPWLRHGILACKFGELGSYLQAGGRLLRASEGKESVVIQDHGGNWWEHGSLNADREWSVGLTSTQVSDLRIDSILKKREKEPYRCKKCDKICDGAVCSCGFTRGVRSRTVVELDGTLQEMYGDIFRPRKVSLKSDTQKKWDSIYWRMKRSGMTWKQAEALFHKEQGYWPPRTLANQPPDEGDWVRKVEEVPRSLLRKVQL